MAEKFEALCGELKEQLPYSAVFGDMKTSAIRSQFEKMVNATSSEGTQAQRESGGGSNGTDEEEEGDEEDEEKKTERDLVSLQGMLEIVFCKCSSFRASAMRAVSNMASSVFSVWSFTTDRWKMMTAANVGGCRTHAYIGRGSRDVLCVSPHLFGRPPFRCCTIVGAS